MLASLPTYIIDYSIEDKIETHEISKAAALAVWLSGERCMVGEGRWEAVDGARSDPQAPQASGRVETRRGGLGSVVQLRGIDSKE